MREFIRHIIILVLTSATILLVSKLAGWNINAVIGALFGFWAGSIQQKLSSMSEKEVLRNSMKEAIFVIGTAREIIKEQRGRIKKLTGGIGGLQ